MELQVLLSLVVKVFSEKNVSSIIKKGKTKRRYCIEEVFTSELHFLRLVVATIFLFTISNI